MVSVRRPDICPSRTSDAHRLPNLRALPYFADGPKLAKFGSVRKRITHRHLMINFSAYIFADIVQLIGDCAPKLVIKLRPF